MKRAALNAVIWSTVISVCLVIGTVGFFKTGPVIEKIAAPVFIDIQSTFIGANYTDGTMDFLITGIKDRNCLMVTPDVSVRINGAWVNATAQMLKKDGTALPIEEQRIPTDAPFIRRFRVSPIGNAVRVGVISQCHPFWLSNTHMFYRELPTGAL